MIDIETAKILHESKNNKNRKIIINGIYMIVEIENSIDSDCFIMSISKSQILNHTSNTLIIAPWANLKVIDTATDELLLDLIVSN